MHAVDRHRSHGHSHAHSHGHGGHGAAHGHAPRHRYSAKNMSKPVNFVCRAPDAKEVFLIGDFNEWNPTSHPMRRQPDGAWHLAVPLHHGHHRYCFLVDGQRVLDPHAHGIARDDHGNRVSLLAVS